MTGSWTFDRLARDARSIYDAALAGVEPSALLARRPLAEWFGAPPETFGRIRIAAIGKGSLPLTLALEQALNGVPGQGLALVPHGYLASWRGGLPCGVEMVEAGHPIPDAAGLAAAERVLVMARSCREGGLFLLLITGGGSALCPAFAEGIDLDSARSAFDLLLRSGASIHEMNVVRKHLSRIGGGQLAAAAAPAAVCALVVSDVPGDDLSVIAGGPAVADPSTFSDAWAVLDRYHLLDRLPEPVCRHLERGLADAAMETPKPGSSALANVRCHLIGNNRLALEAGIRRAAQLGYAVRIAGEPLTGEAREMGRAVVATALQSAGSEPVCQLWGGETTVTMRGQGRGGRNQELALGAALALDGASRPILVLAAGSDGIDGPTDAAGAWATPETLPEARRRGLSAETALQNNDVYPFWEALGGLLRTGPTHVNVMDLALTLTAGDR